MQDFILLTLFVMVLVVPKLLVRFHIPTGITALLIGVISAFFLPELRADQTLGFLSIIGITSLFVFSGLEVEIDELKKSKKALARYLVVFVAILLVVAWGFNYFFELGFQVSMIYSLGVLTPSAGFIISSMNSLNMGNNEEDWIKSRAISKEFVSIVLLFIVLQINEPKQLLISSGIFIIFFLLVPLFFKFYFRFIAPYAPDSGIPFLIALSLYAGVLSKKLGAYYLVGAFLVGLVGSEFLHLISKKDEKVLFRSLSSFFNVFLPFYFFYSGVKLSVTGFSMDAVTISLILLVIFVPLRILMVGFAFDKNLQHKETYRVSFSLLPTLVFGLVIAGVLREKGLIEAKYVYGLILYTVMSSIIPSVVYMIKSQTKNKT